MGEIIQGKKMVQKHIEKPYFNKNEHKHFILNSISVSSSINSNANYTLDSFQINKILY